MIHVDPALSAPGAAPAAATAPSPTAPARALIEGQLLMLSRLAQIGMDIAEACGRDARAMAAAASDEGAGPSPAPRRDPGLVFARVARAVRMTIALQSRLSKDLAALDRADAVAKDAARDARRFRLGRLVRQAAEAAVDARRAHLSPAEAWGRSSNDEDAIEDEIERLSDEVYERLTDAEDGDVWGRSFDEVVAGVAKDLGLSPDWCARLRCAVGPPHGPSRDNDDDAQPDLPPPRRPGDPAAPGLDATGFGGETAGSRPFAPLRPG